MKRRGIGVVLVSCLILVAAEAFPATAAIPASTIAIQGAQATGIVEGTTVDTDGVRLPGVAVTLEGEGLIQQSVTGFSNARGVYRFRGIKPGEYLLRASLSGFRTAQYRVRINVGRTATVDIDLDLAGIEETVVVISAAPLIDASSAQVTSAFSEELIQNIPIPREFIDIADLTPGFADRGAYGAGADASSRYRRGSASNAYTLNGVDVTEPAAGNTWINPGRLPVGDIRADQPLSLPRQARLPAQRRQHAGIHAQQQPVARPEPRSAVWLGAGRWLQHRFRHRRLAGELAIAAR